MLLQTLFKGFILPLQQVTTHQLRNAAPYRKHTLKDIKRRVLVKEHNAERQCLNSLRKNNIIPKALQDVASKELHAMPRDSCVSRLWSRCIVTSRPRGLLKKWRMSRIVVRHEADYNKMSGMKRAHW